MPSLKPPSHPHQKKSDEGKTSSSYTHGFEKIYAIETLDTTTIRPMKKVSDEPLKKEAPDKEPITHVSSSLPSIKKPQSALSVGVFSPHKSDNSKQVDRFQVPAAVKQLPLDFGASFPFFLSPSHWTEPLDSLGLSPFLKRFLKEKSLSTLKDLLDDKGKVKQELTKQLGQGHLDELEITLKQRFGKDAIVYSQQIDTESWLRYLLLEVDPQGAYLLLKDYHLHEAVILNNEQRVGVKHLFEDQKIEKIQKAREQLKSEGKKSWIEEKFKEVARVYLLPWGHQKGGLIKDYEIYQRFLSLAFSRQSAKHCWHFFKDFYFHSQSPFEKVLYPLESSHLFATHRDRVKEFQLFNRLLDSYFYRQNVCYESHKLEQYLLKECALYWVSFPKGFIHRALFFTSKLQKNWGKDGSLRFKRKLET